MGIINQGCNWRKQVSGVLICLMIYLEGNVGTGEGICPRFISELKMKTCHIFFK